MSSSPRVFISHAVKDKKLVDDFFDLLQTGVGLSPNDNFCSSLEGMGIPAGENFVDYIKQKVQSPELIFLMLSPNYLDSLFCLCELGAGWALLHNMIPIVIPPTTYANLKAVLTGIHAYRIDNKSDLSEMREQIVSVLSIDAPAFARWEVKRDKFLDALDNMLKSLDVPEKVSRIEYEEVVGKYEDAKSEFEQYEAEIDKLQETVSRLEECKDEEEVLAVKKDMSDDWTWFEDLCKKAKAVLNPLPSIVQKIIYNDAKDSQFVPNQWNDDWDEIRAAEHNDYVSVTPDNEIRLNRSDPAVERAIHALSEVENFLSPGPHQEGASEGFIEQYRAEYDHNPAYNSVRLWEAHLFG